MARRKGTSARDGRGNLPRTLVDPAEKSPQTTRPKLHAPRRKPHALQTDLCGAERKTHAAQSDFHRPRRKRHADRPLVLWQHPRVPEDRHDGGAQNARRDVVHDDAPAPGEPFEFADGPGLEDVEEAKQKHADDDGAP